MTGDWCCGGRSPTSVGIKYRGGTLRVRVSVWGVRVSE